jgi:TPR repeat protein
MRILTCLLLSVAVIFSNIAHAGVLFAFADVSAGVFRFQVKLAEQGNPEAQYKVGEMYEMGKGATKDLKKAEEWFEKSAKQGHKKSTYKILYLEISSNGLNDFTKSQLGSIRKEAASGNADAQYFLGKMYAAGVGVPKSLTNALTWLNKATFNGISEAEFEAIAVEEELNRIRDRESKRRAESLAAAKKKKADEEKAKKAKQAKDRALAAKRNDQRRNDARRLAEKKRKDKERAAAAQSAQAAQDRLDQKRLQKEQAEAKKQAQSESKEKAAFGSDPCKGKKARFLSTCKK